MSKLGMHERRESQQYPVDSRRTGDGQEYAASDLLSSNINSVGVTPDAEGAQDLQQPFERQYNGDDLFPENPSVNEAWQQALFWASVERHELIRPALEHRHPTEIADTDIYSHQQRGPNGGYAQELCQKDRDLEPAQRARQLDSVAYDVLTPSRPDAMGYEPPNSRYRDAERVVQGGHRSHYGRADYPEWHIDDESRLAQDNNYVLGLEQTRSEDREARRRRRHHHHHHRHHHHQQR